jgi:small subunit ribosomal protein S18
MAGNGIRPIVKLRSTAGTGFTYVTRKNRRNDPDRLVLRKYDPVIRRHVEFREERSAMANKPQVRHAAQPGVRAARKNLLGSLGLSALDYKDTAALRMFTSERGKIRSRQVTGLTVQQQRQVCAANKNAREMALLPYPGQGAAR